MNAATVKPDPMLPAQTPCVECGTAKGDHKKINDRLTCFPLVLRSEEERSIGERGLKGQWRTFR